jgi:predicted DCC family thiol-disulfide oxidoreductase YuxK
MNRLTVLYDPRCSLCCRARRWLADQPTFVELEFIGAGTDHAQRRFPHLNPAETKKDLTVVGDDGSVYRGAKAWVLCLWATRKYREWSLTLGSPAVLPSARRLIDWVSSRRHGFGAVQESETQDA